MKRVWLITSIELLLFALQDVLLWAQIFEKDQLWQYIGIYHEGWMVMLWALIVVGFLWTGPEWQLGALHGVLLLTLAHSGLEDVLYYGLQLRTLPETLPWLNQHPLILFSPVTSQNLMLNVLLWLGAWIIASKYLTSNRVKGDSGYRFEPSKD